MMVMTHMHALPCDQIIIVIQIFKIMMQGHGFTLHIRSHNTHSVSHSFAPCS